MSSLLAATADAHPMWWNKYRSKDGNDIGCCGEHDCYKLEYSSVTQLRDGSYQFNSPDPQKSITMVYVVPEGQAQASEDGNYWACFNKQLYYDSAGYGYPHPQPAPSAGKNGPWLVRCFFIPTNV